MSAVIIQNATKAAHLDLILDGVLDKTSKYSIRIRKNFDTACWSFRPPHHIFIGDGVLKNTKKELKDNVDYYIGSYLYHEVGHSKFTERDLKSVNSFLRRKNMTFRMLNLFEDARIEHLMREETGRAFLWHQYEDLSEVQLKKPLSQYFFLIQNEYSLLDEVAKSAFIEEHKVDKRVAEFYMQTLECKDTWAVVDVMEEWLKVFPQPLDEQNQQLEQIGFDGSSDLSASLNTQDDDYALQELIDASIDINEPKEDEKGKGKDDADIDDHGKPLEEFSSCNYSSSYTTVEINTALVARLFPKLQSIFKGRTIKTNTSRPSKRLSIKSIIADSDKIYRKKTELGKESKRFNLVIDCSGSMYGEPLDNAAAITLLFSKLASSGLVKGSLVLSSDRGYQSFDLPVSQKAIEEHFHTYGAEGFHNTFRCVKPLMKRADVNFVITDGRIGNGALDKAQMTREGIRTFGIYVGDPEYCDLTSWFHRGVARETLTEVVDELRREIQKRPV